MKKYLVCILDDDSYACAEYKIFENANDAIGYAIKECEYNLYYDFGEDCAEYIKKEELEDRIRIVTDVDDFIVCEIFKIDIKETDTNVVVWHHAYEGVDFKILGVGSETECERIFEKSYDEDQEFVEDEDPWKEFGHYVLDTGTEWYVCDTIEIRYL